MPFSVVALWSFAGWLTLIFMIVLSDVTLTPKHDKKRMITVWVGAAAFDLILSLFFYSINISNDIIQILGQPILLCAVLFFFYEDDHIRSLFVGITMALLGYLLTFLFCGTTDTLLGVKLNLFDPVTGPYTVRNILFFSILKVIVLSVSGFVYIRFLKDLMKAMLDQAGSQLKHFLIAPVISIIGFNVISYVTNMTGIVPSNKYFFPFYITICLIFAVEYSQIFVSIRWNSEALKMSKLVREDGLTKLSNKFAFIEVEEKINKEIEEGEPDFSVVIVDLNYLKKINDTYGHDKGDEAISLAAKYLSESFRSKYRYRIGGDEFAIIIDNSTESYIKDEIAGFERLMEKDKGDEEWKPISAAVGMAKFDKKNDRNFQAVFARADENMYKRKKEMKAERTD